MRAFSFVPFVPFEDLPLSRYSYVHMWLYFIGILLLLVVGFYFVRGLRKPSHDRAWVEHHRALPSIQIDQSGLAHVYNVRHARYRSEFDFDLSYSDETYDTNTIRDVWLYVSHWEMGQAHCMLSFEFDDGRFLAASVEVRKVNVNTFRTRDVFFGNYELFYILADEQDVISLRTHIWGPQINDLRLYRLTLTPEIQKSVFRAMADRISYFKDTPQWYRVSKRNCGTEPMRNLYQGGAPIPRWHWRYAITGFLDRALYRYHIIDTTRPFDEVYKTADIVTPAGALPLDESFSARIREILREQITPGATTA